MLNLSGAHDLTADHRTICDEHITLSTKTCMHFVQLNSTLVYSGVRRNFVRGVSTNSVEDRGQRERGSGGGSPLLSGSGGSCNLVQEISFHTVKFS